MSTILSIVPYKFMPPLNGGHWGVVIVEKILSRFNTVHTLTTADNMIDSSMSNTHPLLPDAKWRYLPYNNYSKALTLAKEIHPEYIFCHHHYLFPLASRLASTLNIPLYIRCHNIESERFRSNGKWWWKVMALFEKYAFRHSDRIFFVTEEDKKWAIENYRISKDRCTVMPFGIDFSSVPEPSLGSRTRLAEKYSLTQESPWLFFMGQLDYRPNEEAVQHLINDIFPKLKDRLPHFHLLVCGKNLSAAIQKQISNVAQDNDIVYTGFVPKIEDLLTACDVMLNPVISGGGVKTKVIESLAWNKTVVSTESGAKGIDLSKCGEKLLLVKDFRWDEFSEKVRIALAKKDENIPESFFDYYYSKNIATRLQEYFK